jgi:hypothetical protein
MVLWLVDRVQFLRFTVALLGMSFAAFVVFLLVPVAPPWLAGHHHLLPGGGVAFALGAWLIMTQILVPMVTALQHKPAVAVLAGLEPGPSEPSSADLDTAEQARTLTQHL